MKKSGAKVVTAVVVLVAILAIVYFVKVDYRLGPKTAAPVAADSPVCQANLVTFTVCEASSYCRCNGGSSSTPGAVWLPPGNPPPAPTPQNCGTNPACGSTPTYIIPVVSGETMIALCALAESGANAGPGSYCPDLPTAADGSECLPYQVSGSSSRLSNSPRPAENPGEKSCCVGYKEAYCHWVKKTKKIPGVPIE